MTASKQDVLREQNMNTVKFSEVPVGEWFRELTTGCWHIKVDSSSGMYQRFGTRYQPKFGASANVLVESPEGKK